MQAVRHRNAQPPAWAKVLEAKPCGLDTFLLRQMLPDMFGQYCVYGIRGEEAPPISIHEYIQLIDVGENPSRDRSFARAKDDPGWAKSARLQLQLESPSNASDETPGELSSCER